MKTEITELTDALGMEMGDSKAGTKVFSLANWIKRTNTDKMRIEQGAGLQ